MGKGQKTPANKWTYSKLEDEMTVSPAWKKLSGNACKVLIEFYRYGRGGNAFYKTYKGMKKDLGYSSDTYKRAIKELVENGFIEVTEEGGITRHEVDKNGLTCWNKSLYKLSSKWKKPDIPHTRNPS